MKDHTVYIDLYDDCRWNNTDGVKQILKQNSNLDITHKEGIYFRFIIKNNNVAMLNTLLEYFEKTQLRGDSENQYAIPLAKHKLQVILQNAVNTFDISEKMQDTLNQYLPTEEDSEQGEELEDFAFSTFKSDNEDKTGNQHIELNEDNLKKLEAVENNQIRNFGDLMSFYSPRMETDRGGNYIDLIAKNSHLEDSD
jgi:hypothetical protein